MTITANVLFRDHHNCISGVLTNDGRQGYFGTATGNLLRLNVIAGNPPVQFTKATGRQYALT